jgi:hypothetical protein
MREPQSALSQVPGLAGACADGGAQGELPGVPYFRVVFTLPVRIGAIAYQKDDTLLRCTIFSGRESGVGQDLP